ncbi:MAG: right-handed parallel beta-helix repeat-containing protein [Dehalococcoidia bacterium]|nr:right-handed parallel beta-helix repeat-containing protein [Dehalococcoidia bacterium]
MKKIFGILLLIVLVGDPILVPGVPVAASNSTWYVDGSLGEDDQGKGTGPGGDAFATIQYAIDHAGERDTVVVAAGLYKENVVIDKSLTLKGAQAGVDARDRTGPETIIDADYREVIGISIINDTDREVVIDGLTIQNTFHAMSTPDPDRKPLAAEIVVRNVRALNSEQFGLSLTFTKEATIEYCYVENARYGINAGALRPVDPTIALFRNNLIVNVRYGIIGYLQYSLVEGNQVLCQTTDSVITEGEGIRGQFLDTVVRNNIVSGYVKGAGLSFAHRLDRFPSTNVTVEGNTFTGNLYGIYVFPPLPEYPDDRQIDLRVSFNRIFGNSSRGVRNDGPLDLDAIGNWWGHVDGPGGLGPGNRDRVSARVFYSPWLGAETGTEPMTWGVDPTGSIQYAVDLATSGDTIVVTEGEYREDLGIGKSLTIRSANGAEATAIIGSVSVDLTDEIVFLGGDGVGFTVQADGRDYALRLCLEDGSQVTVRENILAGATAGVDTCPDGLGDNSTVTIVYNRIRQNNEYGIHLAAIGAGSAVLINFNDIVENGEYGLLVRDSAVTGDATDNWWGDASGPYHASANPGATGNGVSNDVVFQPWLGAPLRTLKVSSDARGVVTSPGERAFVYAPGTEVGLEATPDDGYEFDRWTGDVDTIANVRAPVTTITMDGDYSITARFRSMMCFIASAAYGTDTADQIDILREFRDQVLLSNSLGAGFVSLYYRVSRPVALLISRNEPLRAVVRAGLVEPIVSVLNWSRHSWSEWGY